MLHNVVKSMTEITDQLPSGFQPGGFFEQIEES